MSRLLTYNVHRCLGSDGRLSPIRIAEVIASCNADIVALQELDVGRARSHGIDQAAVIAKALGMTMHFHAAVQVMEEQFGDAILTTRPCKLIRTAVLEGKGWIPGREPRGALWASIDIEGRALQVINTHLGVTRRERHRQVGTLLGPDWLGNPACCDPMLLVGDFNALPRGPTFRRFAQRLGGTPSAGISAGKLATFPSHLPLLSIDHVFASPSVRLLGAKVIHTPLSRVASDHLPLLVEFRLADIHGGDSDEERRKEPSFA